MWDRETPLKLLKTMPDTLEKEHFEKLQKLFEADRLKNQLMSDTDLCGTYAEFCANCDKNEQFPCATAYIKYIQSQGENATPETVEEETPEEVTKETEEEASGEEKPEEDAAEHKETPNGEKTRIRIAVVRRKTF